MTRLVSHVFAYERNKKHLSLLVVFFQLNLSFNVVPQTQYITAGTNTICLLYMFYLSWFIIYFKHYKQQIPFT